MIPRPYAINVSKSGIRIDGVLIGESTIAAFQAALGQPRVVEPESKEPDEHGHVPNTLVIWDEAGVMVYTADGETVGSFAVRLAKDPAWEANVHFDVTQFNPRCVFSGVFTIAGKAPLDAIPEEALRGAYIFCKVMTGRWKTILSISEAICAPLKAMEFRERRQMKEAGEIAELMRAAAIPFRQASIDYQAPRVSTGKWTLPEADGEILTIRSFAFKLLIVQELMYEQVLLTPKFDVYDFAANYAKREINPGNCDKMIPEVRAWFRDLPISAALAAKVEHLYIDGGNAIYCQLAPAYGGEDDLFFIKDLTAADVALFPNLRHVEDIGFLSPRARKILTDKGVKITE